MSEAVRLSVIVGVQHVQDNLPEIMQMLKASAHPDVEFLFCHTQADPATPALIHGAANVTAICSPCDSLIPHLWRDGILAARADRVAITTAHCIPSAQWVDALLAVDLDAAVARGGTIDNHPNSDSKGWAIYLLRYAAFAPPKSPGPVQEIAADNAVYRRRNLICHHDLLQRGFWEPSFHARFRAEHLQLRLDPGLTIVHRNRYSGRQFLLQRFRHGCEYAKARVGERSRGAKLLFMLFSPAIPLVLLARIWFATRANGLLRRHFLSSFLWLGLFTLAWSAGEMWGYIMSMLSGRR